MLYDKWNLPCHVYKIVFIKKEVWFIWHAAVVMIKAAFSNQFTKKKKKKGFLMKYSFRKIVILITKMSRQRKHSGRFLLLEGIWLEWRVYSYVCVYYTSVKCSAVYLYKVFLYSYCTFDNVQRNELVYRGIVL